MIIIRSNGEAVELKVVSVDRRKREVVIEIPKYNSQFTFSDMTGRIALTENGRQVINKTQPATIHVARSVYAGLAMWAGSILGDSRRGTLKKPKQKWAVYWQATDGDHFMDYTWAVSARQAVNQVHYRQIAGEATIMLDSMFAKIVNSTSKLSVS